MQCCREIPEAALVRDSHDIPPECRCDICDISSRLVMCVPARLMPAAQVAFSDAKLKKNHVKFKLPITAVDKKIKRGTPAVQNENILT